MQQAVDVFLLAVGRSPSRFRDLLGTASCAIQRDMTRPFVEQE